MPPNGDARRGRGHLAAHQQAVPGTHVAPVQRSLLPFRVRRLEVRGVRGPRDRQSEERTNMRKKTRMETGQRRHRHDSNEREHERRNGDGGKDSDRKKREKRNMRGETEAGVETENK